MTKMGKTNGSWALGFGIVWIAAFGWQSEGDALAQTPEPRPAEDAEHLRMIGDVELNAEDLATLERTMPDVYHDVVSDGWQSRDGFAKYRFVVPRLREQWGHADPLASLDVVDDLDYGSDDGVRVIFSRAFDGASGTLLQQHIRSEKVGNAVEEAIGKLAGLLARGSALDADSLEACARDAALGHRGCLLATEAKFQRGIDDCVGEGASRHAPIQAELVSACVDLRRQTISKDLSSCDLGYSKDSKSCLSNIDWPRPSANRRTGD